MKCPLQREQDRAQKQLAFPWCPPTKAGLRGRAWASAGVWRREELKSQSPGLSAAAARRPPPSVLVPGQHSSLTKTPAQRQRSQAAPRCQGRECQVGRPPRPGAHGQVPCGLPPCGARVGPRTSVCSESKLTGGSAVSEQSGISKRL